MKLLIAFVVLLQMSIVSSHNTGWLRDENPRPVEKIGSGMYLSSALPLSMDYRYLFPNSVTDQMSCGSCYAHAIAGVLEASASKKFGWIKHTAPRNEMIHCFEFNKGCNGGYIERTLNYIIELGGMYLGGAELDTGTDIHPPNVEYCFPDPNKTIEFWDTNSHRYLRHKDGYRCEREAKGYSVRAFWTQVLYRPTKYVKVDTKDQSQMKRALQMYGPLVIGMALTKSFGSMKFLYDPSSDCKTTDPNMGHAVILVGYHGNYWFFRNSWGEQWGAGGHFWMSMNEPCHLIELAIALTYD